ncbi:MAG TPA: hypothetical protein VIK37_02555 [Candidatus Saccharimonadales bacterium]
MSDKYKFFGTEHPGSVPKHITDRRLEQASESHRGKTILKAGALATAAVIAIPILGRAIDHELDSGKPLTPQQGGQLHNPAP